MNNNNYSDSDDDNEEDNDIDFYCDYPDYFGDTDNDSFYDLNDSDYLSEF